MFFCSLDLMEVLRFRCRVFFILVTLLISRSSFFSMKWGRQWDQIG